MFINNNPKRNNKKRMQALYGENKRVTGNYDSDCAAVCANGVFLGKRRNDVLIFKGIPFAKPPVGPLRWKAPEPPENSNSIQEAFYFGKSPIQAPWHTELASYYPVSEDCLYLNVWTDTNRNIKKPVMVFIHGGAFGYGGTSDPLYDGFNFIQAHRDVILVTIAYRIGLMGFVDFSIIPGSEKYQDSPNLGILDQIQALRWIQENISAFGGDPDNVTIFGESAGGTSVSVLPVIDAAKGLFHRVIAQSGSIALTYSRKECAPFTKKLMKKTSAKKMDDLLSMTTDELYQVNLSINEYNNFPMRDGILIPEDLYQAYAEGKSAWVDMLSGTNKDECRYWIEEMGGKTKYAFAIPVLFENQCMRFNETDVQGARTFFRKNNGSPHWRLTEFENDLTFRVPAQEQLLCHADNGGRAFHYFWTFSSEYKTRGACHAVELSSVFNNPDEKIYTGNHFSPVLAAEVQQMWVNFAKTGDPSTKDHPWPLYERKTKQTLILDEKIKLKRNLFSRRTAIIEKLLKYKINGNYAELDYNIPYLKILGAAGIALMGLILTGIVLAVKE